MPSLQVALLLALLMISSAPSVGRADDGAVPQSIEDILACVRKNAPERSMRQRLELKVHDRAGDVQTLKAKLSWKRSPEDLSKLLIRLSAPPDLRGSAFLLIEDEKRSNMFAYLPELRTVRRVTGRHSEGSVFGSDFSYEDLEHLYRMGRVSSSKRLADEVIAERATYVIETNRPAEDESAYSRTLSYIDQQTCVMVKGTFFASDGSVRKKLAVDLDSLEREGEVWIPKKIRIEDLRTATFSELEVGKVELDIEISDNKFTKSALESRGR
jgi:hypothetical protein